MLLVSNFPLSKLLAAQQSCRLQTYSADVRGSWNLNVSIYASPPSFFNLGNDVVLIFNTLFKALQRVECTGSTTTTGMIGPAYRFCFLLLIFAVCTHLLPFIFGGCASSRPTFYSETQHQEYREINQPAFGCSPTHHQKASSRCKLTIHYLRGESEFMALEDREV